MSASALATRALILRARQPGCARGISLMPQFARIFSSRLLRPQQGGSGWITRSQFAAHRLHRPRLGNFVDKLRDVVGLYVDPPAPATYFNWKQKYDGLLPTEMRTLKQLEDENAKLKRIVADLSLDKEMLQDAIRRKL